ncbi:MAG TPA: hypothetical protein VKH37_04265 [Ferruginibacter sp.]|nr:hypothetical protein [Ferruginibacter sp.]
MNRLVPYACALLCTLYTTAGFSQTGSAKPKQFDSYPRIINCSEAEISRAFTTAAGQNIDLSFSDNFHFTGAVTSNEVKYSNLQSVVVKSPMFNNTVFAISKRIAADNSISYVGRIINKNYFDGFELKKNVSGNYQLVKIETDKVIQDCSQH